MTNMMNHSQAVVCLRKIVAYHLRSKRFWLFGRNRLQWDSGDDKQLFLNGDERIDSHLIFSKDR